MVKRIYGNFVGDNGKWKAVINEHAIKPMQQFAYTTGKNATLPSLHLVVSSEQLPPMS